MFRIRRIAGLAGLVLAAALPLTAAEPAAPACAPALSQMAPAAAPDLPAELEGVPPAPIPAYGIKYGPCTVSVTCIDDTYLQCGGVNICYWKLDSFSSRGFVECDGQRYNCPPL